MFWIICLFLLVVTSFIACLQDEAEFINAFIGSLLLFIVVTLVLVCAGINIYPNIKAQREEILSLQNTISLVESGHYEEIKDGTLIGGSLDNMSQSTAYTEYLKEYAYKKARFNKHLTGIQIKKKSGIFVCFSYYFFVSSEVKKIEKL